MSGTDVGHSRYCARLCCYAVGMRCPVLTSAMLIQGPQTSKPCLFALAMRLQVHFLSCLRARVLRDVRYGHS
eukprot:3083374-Rhodomonas_salina.8